MRKSAAVTRNSTKKKRKWNRMPDNNGIGSMCLMRTDALFCADFDNNRESCTARLVSPQNEKTSKSHFVTFGEIFPGKCNWCIGSVTTRINKWLDIISVLDGRQWFRVHQNDSTSQNDEFLTIKITHFLFVFFRDFPNLTPPIDSWRLICIHGSKKSTAAPNLNRSNKQSKLIFSVMPS